MSHWYDNVHTTAFTPRDYQVELLATAVERNIMICVGHKSSKEFIALKLIQELAIDLRKNSLKQHNNKKHTIYLTNQNGETAFNLIYHLTDLSVYLEEHNNDDNISEFDESELIIYDDYHVLILNPQKFLSDLENGKLNFDNINLLIIEDCHNVNQQDILFKIFNDYYMKYLNNKPKVLNLAGPLHSAGCLPIDLKGVLDIFEKNLNCKAETASDIVTVLRYCTKPKEYILQCAPTSRDDLIIFLEEIIFTKKQFLQDHRFDPSEIYSDEFSEELQGIPDPKIEPMNFLDNYLEILYEMGPWCADRVALSLLSQIEKQKVKTPYERHFLLLCLVSTAFVEIRSYCDYVFHKLRNEKERIEKYSSPKVLRLIDILRLYKPEEQKTENKNLAKISHELETMDFQKLQQTLENTFQCIEKNENREVRDVLDNLENIVHIEQLNKLKLPLMQQSVLKNNHIDQQKFDKRKSLNTMINNNKDENTIKNKRNNTNNHRQRRRYYPNSNCNGGRNRHKDYANESELLCGILYCDKKNTAKVLFDLLCEMSRHDPDLSFLCVQYTVDRVADLITEAKEAELEHRRQEEVLKRFRMHECNLLIGTAVLEEGIDLPKCNLVIRWDPPSNYRSYVQCKGKARAVNAHHIILVAPSVKIIISRLKNENDNKNEKLSDYCHQILCSQDEKISDEITKIIAESNIIDNNVVINENNLKNIYSFEKSKNNGIKLEKVNNGIIHNKSDVSPIDDLDLKNDLENNGIKLEKVNNGIIHNKSDVSTIDDPDLKNDLGKNLDDNNDENLKINSNTKNHNISNNKSSKINGFIDILDIESLDDALAKLSIKTENSSLSLRNHSNTNSSINSSTGDENKNIISDNLNAKKNTCLAIEKYNDNFAAFKTNELLKKRNNLNLINNNDDETSKPKSLPFKCNIPEQQSSILKTSIKFVKISLEEMENSTNLVVDRLAEYREIEKILLEKCANTEPPNAEHLEADKFLACIEPYKPLPHILTGVSVNLGSAISIVNKYCAKLPSDTFTKLTPLWRCAKTIRNGHEMYQYTIRLPINSPLKYDIVGLPMPTKILARRIAALQTCKELHQTGELDNNLQPIGKEGFRAAEPDWEIFDLEDTDKQIVNENSEPRPGTTKRRQYYYKRIASEFSNCRPTANTTAYLYYINLTLQCPIPEEQNTRGRKIYPPEDAQQGFGILTLKKIPKVSAFPIFTRSGEVKVSIELSKTRICLTADQILRINTFLNYTFTNVLRLQKFLMLFDGNATENSIFIVPTVKKTKHEIVIDWQFLEEICKNCDKMPTPVPDEMRKNVKFDPNRFKDAVIMPWYRNQDQPQYFYVAEICHHLSPESSFPGENYSTFKEYYFLKYGITIQNPSQPLLDVDHTSARLNFLTPRYVNRKGVALPTSSEETKRAKRENLEQKQILVPELCTIHPFPASLWRAAVCLPCILYRINGLLLADEIRKKVSYDLALGQQEIEDELFDWPILDFGWSLAEVLKKCKDETKITNSSVISDKNLSEDLEFAEKVNFNGNGCKKKADSKKNDINSTDTETFPDNNITDEKSLNDILAEADEKLKADSFIEIGTWSNDMANNNFDSDSDLENEWGILPPNVNLCSTNNTKIRYGSPTSWDDGKSGNSSSNQRHNDKYFSDSDASYQSDDDDFDIKSIQSDTDDNQTGPIRIEFKSNNVAEAIETEEEIAKRQKQLAIIQETSLNEKYYQLIKNQETGFELKKYRKDLLYYSEHYAKASNDFHQSTKEFKEFIWSSGLLRRHNEKLEYTKKEITQIEQYRCNLINIQKIIPYLSIKEIEIYFQNQKDDFDAECVTVSLENLQELNQLYLKKCTNNEKFTIEGNCDIFDNFNDNQFIQFKPNDEKDITIDFNRQKYLKQLLENHDELIHKQQDNDTCQQDNDCREIEFSFDYQPNLIGHPGPSPSIILQGLTMSNANDGINLERLETIGDSFLKYAITSYLYCTYENVHEGKLSHLRSKQVSNLNLYRLGRKKVLGECMIATKFEPHDNWLPPCYYVPKELEKALIEAKIPPCHWNLADLPNIKDLSSEEICELVRKKAESLGLFDEDDMEEMIPAISKEDEENEGNFTCFIPYNLVTQHSIPDKSVADCVEALIGAYLIECGPRGALLYMAWLGIRVLPITTKIFNPNEPRLPGSTQPDINNVIKIYGEWKPPKSPLLKYSPQPYEQLNLLLDGFSRFEDNIGYHFIDRSYLLQAMTHASYSPNRLTDCYQRLEFLGDAVLDYLITRHLYEDPRQHSPGALTDLRSALVNNTIFASLAVRHGFHKYFRHLSPGLNEVIDRFVRIQHENGHIISEEYYLLSEEECDDAEDVEVPKALGDVFESVAGAIFLDSNMSLDMVWKVYSNMMKPEIEQFSNSVPKSPIRELLELEPETAKFGRPEKLADGRRVRVTVEVFGKGIFRGIGRNYRIAKCTAAKCALRQLKKQGLITKKH